MATTTTKTASKTKTAPKAKATTKAAPKVKAQAKAQAAPTAITILDKAFTYGGEGTERRKSWDALATQKGKATVEQYKAKGGKVKYLRRWADAGKIKLAA